MGIPTAILDPKRSSVAAPLWCRLEGLLLAEPREPLDQELKIGLYGTVSDVFWITLRRHYGVVIVWHRSDRARSWFMVGYDERRWSKTLPVNANQFLGVTDSPPPGSGRHHVRIMASADRTDTLDHWRTLVSGPHRLPFLRVRVYFFWRTDALLVTLSFGGVALARIALWPRSPVDEVVSNEMCF